MNKSWNLKHQQWVGRKYGDLDVLLSTIIESGSASLSDFKYCINKRSCLWSLVKVHLGSFMLTLTINLDFLLPTQSADRGCSHFSLQPIWLCHDLCVPVILLLLNFKSVPFPVAPSCHVSVWLTAQPSSNPFTSILAVQRIHPVRSSGIPLQVWVAPNIRKYIIKLVSKVPHEFLLIIKQDVRVADSSTSFGGQNGGPS